jgi:hypothetical protein
MIESMFNAEIAEKLFYSKSYSLDGILSWKPQLDVPVCAAPERADKVRRRGRLMPAKRSNAAAARSGVA